VTVSDVLLEMQEWERADASHRQALARKVESERATGDAQVQRVGVDAAALLIEFGVPSDTAVDTAITHRVKGMTTHTVVTGPAGWTLPGSGFGVSTEGRLLQIWMCCADGPTSYSWRPARCWHPTDTTLWGGLPKRALWPHHDSVCLDDKHGFQPIEEIVALGIHRLVSRQPERCATSSTRLPSSVLASSLSG
jgi:hypothetical protein